MPSRSRPTQEASPLRAERYGAPPRWSRPVTVAAVALLAAAALAWLLWAAVAQSSPAVSARLESFEAQPEHRMTVTVAVLRRQGDPVRCEVYAEAADHVVVGELGFDVPGGAAGTVTVTRHIETERAATTAVLRTCEVAPPASPAPTAPGNS